MTDLTIKRGATLQLLIACANDDGSAFDLTHVVVSSQVRNAAGGLIASLAPATTAIAGQLSIQQATAAWPVGRLMCDLKFVNAGIVLKSDTFGICVVLAETA